MEPFGIRLQKTLRRFNKEELLALPIVVKIGTIYGIESMSNQQLIDHIVNLYRTREFDSDVMEFMSQWEVQPMDIDTSNTFSSLYTF